MTEQSDKQVAVSGQLPSLRPLIDEQPAGGDHQPGPKRGCLTSSETLKPAALPQSDAQLGRSLGQILIVLVVLLVLVNIPINFYGAGLAQIIPKATAIVILRRISNPEAFDYYLRQYEVHVVEDNVLESFGQGRSIYRLVTCPNSPHIYVLEQGQKRWVKDPPTRNKAKPWDEVRLVSCDYLRQLPEGPPILKDAGPPP
jgi:hypothetical protein